MFATMLCATMAQINTVFLVMALVALGRNMKQKAKSQDKDMYSRQAMYDLTFNNCGVHA